MRFTRAHAENFPVLSRFVPARLRDDFGAVYAFCRAADDLADEGGRDAAARERALSRLSEFGEKTRRAARGEAEEPLFIALAQTMRRHALPLQPFLDLIAAFESDQRTMRHETWESLIEYSKGSANPVGRLVLMLFGYRPPEEDPANAPHWERSDAVCTALQLTNFWQDVRRDYLERDRVYLPLRETGLSASDLAAWIESPTRAARERFRAALRPLAARTWGLFDAGRGLPELLSDEAAPVVRLFIAGGEAVLRKIAAMEFETLWRRPRLSKAAKAWLVLRESWHRPTGRRGSDPGPVFGGVRHDAARRTGPKPDATIIVGAGLAGMAAAVELAERGERVILLEARRRLGGRAASFVDAGTGETLDNCQHVTLGCCTEYLDLCRRVGASDRFEWHAEQYWIEAGGRESILRPGLLPAPAHYAEAFLAAAFLTMPDKLAVGRAMLAIAAAAPREFAGRTFGELLRERDQPAGAVDRFWSPIIVSACNLSVERVSAPLAMKVFRDGFLAPGLGARAGLIGVPRVPLARLYDGVERMLAESGGEVCLGATVEQVWHDRVQIDGEELRGRGVICALPVEKACRVIAPEARAGDDRLPAMEGVEFSPILGVHIEFDRPVLRRPHAVLVDRGTQWLFRKNESGSRLHAVVSAADDWMDLGEVEITERIAADCAACLPAAANARITWARVVKERRATFAATPAFDLARPSNRGTLPHHVILAGDYTDTGWPATMEGAVRSGRAAANALDTSLTFQHPSHRRT